MTEFSHLLWQTLCGQLLGGGKVKAAWLMISTESVLVSPYKVECEP